MGNEKSIEELTYDIVTNHLAGISSDYPSKPGSSPKPKQTPLFKSRHYQDLQENMIKVQSTLNKSSEQIQLFGL